VRTARVLAAGLGALALLPAAAPARSLTIGVDSRGFVSRLGPLHPLRHPFLRDARAAFGAPTTVRPSRGECRARWARLRLKALFTSFGGISDFCRDGRFQTAVVRSKVWRTWKGLRVGMRSSRIPELHPRARFERGKWVLATQSVFGPDPSPTVIAHVRGGRVRALTLFVGAAGD
jgi:hypothetical protein